MRCPFCQSDNTRVIDSRETDEGQTVRRRRACLQCDERYNTFERVELVLPQVIKTNGECENFDKKKLKDGLSIALQKRPIDAERINMAMQYLLRHFATLGKDEINSRDIGEAVMEQLRELDEVAYVRFASVYRKFQDLNEFNELVQRLREVLPVNDSSLK